MAAQNSMSVTAGDARTSKKILDSKKPIDRTQSLSETIVYSMAEDSPIAPFGTATAVPTRSGTPAEGRSTNYHSADPVARLRNGFTEMSRSGSTDSLAAAGERIEASKQYLAGSKALDHLSTLITSCETFFHPSNAGPWSGFLTAFLSHLTNNFVQRWKAEEEPDCKTPLEWRLTPEIKRSFVLCLRPVALTAMFNKEMDSAQPAISTLRRLALLEPDLIMPAIMERAVPSLQGLEETQRTASVTFAVAVLAAPIAGRRIWRFGGLYIADIFTLLLPGIDLNDPTKTGLTCMAICNMVDLIRIGDISEVDESAAKAVKPGSRWMRTVPRPPTEDDPNDPVSKEFEDLSAEEVEYRVRESTAAFREWVPEFLGRVLLLFANLPEEGGKTGRAGGKTELLTLQSVLHTCGAIFLALDDKLFDAALDQIVEYATTTTRSNAVDAVGELVRNLASVNATKTFERLFPICRQRIIAELKAGASSTRTTTTSIPRPSDAPLHWWLSILYGLLVPGRLQFDNYREDYLDLLRVMLQHTYSERGWRWASKVVEKTLSCLTATYPEEMHLLNRPDRESDDFKLNHTMWWGKLYRPADVMPQWKTPTDANVDMALEIIKIADEAVTGLNKLLDNRTADHEWINDFCRAIALVDEVLVGSHSLIEESSGKELSPVRATDIYPYKFPEQYTKLAKPYKAGFLLTDPADPRYQQVMQFRQRTGEMLNRAATILRTAGDSDNSVDCVKLLLNAIGSFLLAYGMRSKKYISASNAYETLRTTKRLFEGQRMHHRSVLLGASQVHHSNRLMNASYYRNRSPLDDKLIQSVLEFCLSPFVRIRRRAQTHFDSISKTYRGTQVLSLPTLFDALQPGTDPDRMKGALYVLRYNVIGIMKIVPDWCCLVQHVDSLLNAHHEPKASIQTLVIKAMEETVTKVREPTMFQYDVGTEAVDQAADDLTALISIKPDAQLIEAVKAADDARIKYQEEQYDLLVDHIRKNAADTSLNWRYQQAATRFLFSLVRRDRPTDVRLVDTFLQTAMNPHPRIRDYGMGGITRVLFQATHRSYTVGDRRRLMVQEPIDPLASEIDLTNMDDDFTAKYFASFREEPTEDSVLQDRIETGWLCWGKTMEVSRFTKWDEQIFNLDPECKPGIDLIVQAASDSAWWKQLSDYWSQEETRNFPSAPHIDLILALAQVVGRPVFDQIRPLVDSMLADMDEKKVYDRHVTRAMYELLAGLLRGSCEWPGRDRKDFWDWFTPLLPELFRNVRQDTVKCWDVTFEYILHEQDPRRFKPIVDFVMENALSADFQGDSAFNLARRAHLARSFFRCIRWRGRAWSPDIAALCFRSLDCPYAEVRNVIATILNSLDHFEWGPAYRTSEVLVETVLEDTNCEVDIMGILHPPFEEQMNEAVSRLQQLREERPHGPTAAMSAHDCTAITSELVIWMY